MAKVVMDGTLHEKAGAVEYIMPAAFAEQVLRSAPKKVKPQDYLVQYVNEQCGLLYKCTKVTID